MDETTAYDLFGRFDLIDYRARAGSLKILRAKRSWDDAAVVVSFEDTDGIERRGMRGRCWQGGNSWAGSGGGIGSLPKEDVDSTTLWEAWGTWGPCNLHGVSGAYGWITDPAATSARLTDSAGRRLDDAVENGTFVFMWTGHFEVGTAQLELLDGQDRALRSGSM